MRSILDSATLPVSNALRGMKPQHTVAKTMASKMGSNSLSNGQLMKIDFAGSMASFPWPKCTRAPLPLAWPMPGLYFRALA